jgi:hypothetical protein
MAASTTPGVTSESLAVDSASVFSHSAEAATIFAIFDSAFTIL